VSENFFGGFKKDDDESKRLNRKQWIDELILKSKQLKVNNNFMSNHIISIK
jgi:hypothetical protein